MMDKSRVIGAAVSALENIKELVERLEQGDETAHDDILVVPISVQVRSGWYTPGAGSPAPAEYRILLITGGPAVQITGTLGRWGEPKTAKIQYQDWFAPWEELETSAEDEEALLTFARQFYYG